MIPSLAKLLINDQSGQYDDILSEEGSTQGDVPAMAMYAIGTRPLLDKLMTAVDPELCKQVWYADDSAGAGKLNEMKKWWDELNQTGPKYGYFPKPSKTILIVKDPEKLELANAIFGRTGITIDVNGERHLGAAIGSKSFKEKYVKKKVDGWIEDVKQLSKIAKEEPQIAHSAYTKAMCMRWSFAQRTIADIGHLFQPLEDVIRAEFIPAIVGRKISDFEREIMALPVRFGGIGILNPTKTADVEFQTSLKITTNLRQLIYHQERNLDNYDEEEVKSTINKAKQDKGKRLTEAFENIKVRADDNMKRNLDLAREKGAGAWLTSLPLLSYDYVLNKQFFRDALCIRYGWPVPNTPQYCGCGKKFDVDHALVCMKGGYVIMRHNRIRDLEASILRDICKDVRVEPELLPIANPTQSTNNAQGARLDVSAIGIWSPMERTFLDVRVVHPNANTYKNQPIEQIYRNHESLKKSAYNNRIVQVERASFTPLVFSTSGGMALECTRYHKQIAQKIALKTKEEYSHVMNHLRTRIRYTLLKSTLIAIRGERGKERKSKESISSLSFNMMPEMPSYEV